MTRWHPGRGGVALRASPQDAPITSCTFGRSQSRQDSDAEAGGLASDAEAGGLARSRLGCWWALAGLARQEPRGGGGLLSNWVEAVLLDAGFEADDITEVTPILLKQKVIGAALLQLTLEELMQDGVPRGLP